MIQCNGLIGKLLALLISCISGHSPRISLNWECAMHKLLPNSYSTSFLTPLMHSREPKILMDLPKNIKFSHATWIHQMKH